METTLTSASIAQFLNSLSENGHGPNTIRAYRSDLMGLLSWMVNQEQDETEAMAAKYLNAHRAQWAPKTTRRKLGTYRTWAKWTGNTDFLRHYKAPTPDRAQPKPIAEGIPAVLRMIDACGLNSGQRALVTLCGLCGLRAHEALAIRPRDINFQARVLTVRGKGDKTRTVPISDTAFPHLLGAVGEAYARGGESETLVNMGDRWARDFISRLARRVGLPPTSSHQLRATFATAAYAKTHDLRAVQDLLGHASSTTTEVYTGVSNAAMRRAVDVA